MSSTDNLEYDFTARELYEKFKDMSFEEAKKFPKGLHRVLYEDGVVLECKHNYLVFDKYIWQMYEGFEDTPLVSTTTIKAAVGDGSWSVGSTDKALEACLQHICTHNGLRAYEDKEVLVKRVMEIPTRIQNELSHRIGHKVLPMSAVDVVKVAYDPELQEILKDESTAPEAINRVNNAVIKLAKTTVKDHVLYKAIKSGSARESSFAQLFGRRGYITDLNGIVFPMPIMGGFARGIGPKYYPILIESRTAAKAYNATIDSIKKSEWASRRFQKLTMTVEYIINKDCGTTNYMPLFIDEKILSNADGVYYVTKDDPTLRMITPKDKHLLGKEILIRVPWNCKVRNPHDTCIYCAGEVFNNFPKFTNLGYTSSAFMMEIVSQYNLSLKHIIASITGSMLKLDGKVADYFVGNSDNKIEFKKIKQEDMDNLLLVLNGRELIRLGDILNSSVVEVDTESIGTVNKVILGQYVDGKASVIDDLNMGANETTVHLTKEFIEHIKNSRYEVSDNNKYVIPMKGWDMNKPLFEVPIKEADMNAFITALESMVEGGTDKKDDVTTHFHKLVKLVLPNINVPLSALIIMTYGLTVYNPEMGNYRLGRNSPVSRFATRNEIFRNNSLTPFLIGGHQAPAMMANPVELISVEYRQRNALDVMIVPNEIVGNK